MQIFKGVTSGQKVREQVDVRVAAVNVTYRRERENIELTIQAFYICSVTRVEKYFKRTNGLNHDQLRVGEGGLAPALCCAPFAGYSTLRFSAADFLSIGTSLSIHPALGPAKVLPPNARRCLDCIET
jgi:hypothetical protein